MRFFFSHSPSIKSKHFCTIRDCVVEPPTQPTFTILYSLIVAIESQNQNKTRPTMISTTQIQPTFGFKHRSTPRKSKAKWLQIFPAAGPCLIHCTLYKQKSAAMQKWQTQQQTNCFFPLLPYGPSDQISTEATNQLPMTPSNH